MCVFIIKTHTHTHENEASVSTKSLNNDCIFRFLKDSHCSLFEYYKLFSKCTSYEVECTIRFL